MVDDNVMQSKIAEAYFEGFKTGYGKGFDDGKSAGYVDAKERAFAAVESLNSDLAKGTNGIKIRQGLESQLGKRLES